MGLSLLPAERIGCTSVRTSTKPAVHIDRLQPVDPTARPWLVLIHGGSHTGDCYLRTPDGRPGWATFFARCGFPVAVVDWPGVGRSDSVPLEELTGELICATFAALIDQYDAPVVLLTHSMSGAYGWRLLETRAAQIAALVSIAPAPPGNIQPVAAAISEDDDAFIVARGAAGARVPKREGWVPDESFVTEKLVGSSQRFPRAALDGYAKSLTPLPPRLMQERLNLNGSQLRVDRPETLAGKPVLIVTGTEDRDHSRERDGEIADWLNKAGAQTDYWYLADLGINGNGHMLMLEDNSDEIAGLIVGWLSEKLAASAGRR